MGYTFVLNYPDPRVKKVSEWSLLLDNPAQAMDVMLTVYASCLRRMMDNPHAQAEETGLEIRAIGQTQGKILGEMLRGRPVLLNRFGGWRPFDAAAEVRRCTQETMTPWPGIGGQETITVSRWPGGKHWYLSSDQPAREFSCGRFTTAEAAVTYARRTHKNSSVKVKEG